MRVLIGCEFSGTVRRAFRELGHDAWSCDLLSSTDNSPHHIQDDVRRHLRGGWDLAIFHPPCTYLTVSGNRWMTDPRFKGRDRQRKDALKFVVELWSSPIPLVAIENPIGVLSTLWRKPDQVIQPWMFGHSESKATCLWLRFLPPLKPTIIMEVREQRLYHLPPAPDRWMKRSITYPNIAMAMAEQWGVDCAD